MSAASVARPAQGAEPTGSYEWRGLAMGTDARIVFDAVDPDFARAISTWVSLEIGRLESALSLFRENSEISRLNRQATLRKPSGDMRRSLELALAVARATGGLFDPTVQALWEMYADWFAASPAADIPPQSRIAQALRLVDWRKVQVQPDTIRLGTDQRITLNGLGQGYVTDRIAELLRHYGFDHVLVDLGEQRALGPRADGGPWRIALEGVGNIDLADGALATSEGQGCVLDGKGAVHHLFDPRTGHSAGHWQRVTVHHQSATIADALSTAFYAASEGDLAAMIETIGGVTVWTMDRDGNTRRWLSSR
jgi:thiamine biosynthesis lipoprotein